jgi:hypothetical protein
MPPHFRHHASDALLPADDAIRAPTTLSGETNPLALPTRSVHFWPTGTSHERRILQVNADSDAVRMRINLKGSGSPDVCIYSRRTGARVINLVWLGPAAAHLLFEPSDGPGEYEVYWRCAQADLDAPPPPEARWQELASEWARLAANGQRPLVPRVTLGRTEAFSVIGPDWPGPRDDGGYGSRRFSLGNVRARIRLEPADATAAAVRCAVEWRRHRWPSQTRLYLFHEAEPYRAVRNMALLAAPDPRASADEASERVEIVFQPEHGSGEYLLYYHAHATRHATYDGISTSGGTTRTSVGGRACCRAQRLSTSRRARTPTGSTRWIDRRHSLSSGRCSRRHHPLRPRRCCCSRRTDGFPPSSHASFPSAGHGRDPPERSRSPRGPANSSSGR